MQELFVSLLTGCRHTTDVGKQDVMLRARQSLPQRRRHVEVVDSDLQAPQIRRLGTDQLEHGLRRRKMRGVIFPVHSPPSHHTLTRIIQQGIKRFTPPEGESLWGSCRRAVQMPSPHLDPAKGYTESPSGPGAVGVRTEVLGEGLTEGVLPQNSSEGQDCSADSADSWL